MPATGRFSAEENRLGYAIGSGIEVALGGNWSGKIEHLYVDLGSRTYNFTLNGAPQVLTTRVRDHVFRGGVNYRFGGPATPIAMTPANWAGFYVGVNRGSMLGRNASAVGAPGSGLADTLNLSPEGHGGGGQIGYAWQNGAWVFGIEADVQGSFAKDKDACISNCGTATEIAIKQTLPWFATARGRLGYSLGSTLLYATGGFAYGETRTRLTAFAPAPSVSLAHRSAGWTVGAGVERPVNLFGLLGPNWTGKTEYLFVDLGRSSDVTAAALGSTFSTRTQAHTLRGGISYHFGSPVAVRP